MEPDPGPLPWKTWTLRNLDPEKPGHRKKLDPEKPGLTKTWTHKNLDSQKPGLWKIWTLKILDYEKRGKQLDAEEKIRRPHGIIY